MSRLQEMETSIEQQISAVRNYVPKRRPIGAKDIPAQLAAPSEQEESVDCNESSTQSASVQDGIEQLEDSELIEDDEEGRASFENDDEILPSEELDFMS